MSKNHDLSTFNRYFKYDSFPLIPNFVKCNFSRLHSRTTWADKVFTSLVLMDSNTTFGAFPPPSRISPMLISLAGKIQNYINTLRHRQVQGGRLTMHVLSGRLQGREH